MINAGDDIIITDANGIEWKSVALSAVQHGDGHRFPIVWVKRPLTGGEFEPMPWPAGSVRAVKEG
jgi:hypothetical protein